MGFWLNINRVHGCPSVNRTYFPWHYHYLQPQLPSDLGSDKNDINVDSRSKCSKTSHKQGRGSAFFCQPGRHTPIGLSTPTPYPTTPFPPGSCRSSTFYKNQIYTLYSMMKECCSNHRNSSSIYCYFFNVHSKHNSQDQRQEMQIMGLFYNIISNARTVRHFVVIARAHLNVTADSHGGKIIFKMAVDGGKRPSKNKLRLISSDLKKE